jgi:large subunit ribosomal protein L17
MFSNMVQSLIEHEQIRTTDAKAKELRRIAEPVISWAASVGSINVEKADAHDKAKLQHAMHMAQRVVRQRPVLQKLFQDIGPRFVGRPGGYTRIMKLGNRHGDAAPMSIIELVDFGDRRAADRAAAEEAAKEKGKKGGKKAAAEKQEAAPAKAEKKKAKSEGGEAKAEKKKAKKKKDE